MMMYTFRLIGCRDYFVWCSTPYSLAHCLGFSEGLKESMKVSVLIDCVGVFIGLSLRSV